MIRDPLFKLFYGIFGILFGIFSLSFDFVSWGNPFVALITIMIGSAYIGAWFVLWYGVWNEKN